MLISREQRRDLRTTDKRAKHLRHTCLLLPQGQISFLTLFSLFPLVHYFYESFLIAFSHWLSDMKSLTSLLATVSLWLVRINK